MLFASQKSLSHGASSLKLVPFVVSACVDLRELLIMQGNWEERHLLSSVYNMFAKTDTVETKSKTLYNGFAKVGSRKKMRLGPCKKEKRFSTGLTLRVTVDTKDCWSAVDPSSCSLRLVQQVVKEMSGKPM